MTIGKKLTLSYMVVLAGAGVVAGVSLWAIQGLDARFDTAVSKTARKLQLGVELNRLKSDLYLAQRGYILASLARDKGQADEQRAEFDRQIEAINQKLEEVHPLVTVPEGRRLLAVFEADLANWQNEYQAVLKLCEAGSGDAAQRYSMARIAPVYAEMTVAANQFAEVYRRVLEDDKRAAAGEYRFALWLFGFSALVLGAVAGMAFLTIARMLRGLRHAVAELSEGAAQVAAAAGQVASFSQWSAHGSSQQAASLEETSASGEEINSMARKNSESSRLAAGLMTHAQETFAQANQSLDESVAAMGEINAQSERISKIIKVIDEIAFQTNILALNAAVEAARAGEAGRGFAVVAGEVRSLAQRCAQAARDTALLIEESIAKSSAGRTKVDQVATAIRAITAETAQVKMLVDEVSLGSREQTHGIEEISRAISHMQQLTQSTAANAEETAAASQELNAQSATLRDVVQHLSALVGSSRAVPAFPGAPMTRLPDPDGPHLMAPARTGFDKSKVVRDNAAARKALPGRTKPLAGAAVGINVPNRGAFPLDDTFREF